MQRTSVREALIRLRARRNNHVQHVRHYFERRQLESNLAVLVQAANGHEAQGVPSGSPVFVLLLEQSQQLVNAYCERRQITPDQLSAELPALGKLRQLAQPASPHPQAAKSLLAVAAAMLLSFLLGIAGGLMRLGYHLIGGGR